LPAQPLKASTSTNLSFGMRYHAALKVGSWLAQMLMLLLTTAVAWAQAPAWQLAVAATGGTSEVLATAADASGNVFLTGTFTSTVAFGGTTLTSAGRNDVFVAKWSSSAGRFAWVQRAGGAGDDSAPTIAVSGTSVYIAGRFAGTAAFGATSLVTVGSDDGFVAKLTDAGASGAFVWAFGIGGRDSEAATAVTATGSSVYVGGRFYSPTATFGSLVLTNFSAVALPPSDGFVAKLTDAGSTAGFAWVQQVGGSGADQVLALASVTGGVYATGTFAGTVSFGPATLGGGSLSAFVTRLTDTAVSSRFAWAVGTSSGVILPAALAINGPNVYMAGQFASTISFGSVALTGAGTRGDYDAFVAKIADAGTAAGFTWAVQAGGGQSDYATAVAASGSSVYVAGGFLGISSFGSSSLTSAPGSDDAYVAKLTDAGPTGSFAWATAAGGNGSDRANALTLGAGTVYVAGQIMPPASFGPIAVASPAGTFTAFLAAIADPTLTAIRPDFTAGSLLVFPNPAHSRATVQVPAVPGVATATITVLDALGRTLRTQTAATNLATDLYLVSLVPGLYVVRVVVGDRTATQKLVVE
jgi:hypothetical protein